MALALKIASHSETGLVRKNNQDSGYASSQLIAVADGMGGAAAGDLASALVIDAIRRIDKPTVGEEMLEALAGAIHKANDRIADLVEANGALDGMGTTVTGALFDGTHLGLAHIGDSRAYLLRDGHLQQLTHDHSWVQSLLDEGKIDPNEAAIHPHRSLLLKVLNGQPANDPDLTLVRLAAGDRLLFCSDGLCGQVDDEAIAELLQRGQPADALACLLDEARVQGGVDNITIIVADVVEEVATVTSEQVVLGAAADRSIPAANTKVRADDSEDTLITSRPASAAQPAEPEDEARYNPRPPHRRRHVRQFAGLVVVVLLATVALGSAYAWTRTQYFVGVAQDRVAIYQGLSDSLPGLKLSHVYEVQPLAIGDLPPYYQEKVKANIEVQSLSSARQTVGELTEAAQRCVTEPSRKATASALPSRSSPTHSPTTPSARPPGTPNPSQPAAPRSSAASYPGNGC